MLSCVKGEGEQVAESRERLRRSVRLQCFPYSRYLPQPPLLGRPAHAARRVAIRLRIFQPLESRWRPDQPPTANNRASWGEPHSRGIWPVPASPRRRSVNQKSREFVVEMFGSSNTIRTLNLLVNSHLVPSFPGRWERERGEDFPTIHRSLSEIWRNSLAGIEYRRNKVVIVATATGRT